MLESAGLPITISGVTKTYGAVYALDSFDLAIQQGEFLTLLGPSGSGKTTLLMALAGFLRPDSGSIKFADREIILTPPHKRDVGMVFQNYALFPHMTVAANVGYPLNLRKRPADEIAEKVEAAGRTLHHHPGREIPDLDGLDGAVDVPVRAPLLGLRGGDPGAHRRLSGQDELVNASLPLRA